MKHYISEIVITDSINQLAPVLQMTLLPWRESDTKVDNVALQTINGVTSLMDLPGLFTELTNLTIRANNVPIASLLQAKKLYVSEASDFVDGDTYGYRLVLVADSLNCSYNHERTCLFSSPTPRQGSGLYSYNKITKKSFVGDEPEAGYTAPSGDMFRVYREDTPTTYTAYSCAYTQTAEDVFGINFNISGMPVYDMSGTFDWQKVTAVQFFSQYLEPFNTFAHTKYVVRLRNNVQLPIGNEYIEGNVLECLPLFYNRESRGRYTPTDIKSLSRTYSRYDHVLFDKDVLCVGGERYGPDTNASTTSITGVLHEEQIYTANRSQQVVSGEETWVEGTTYYDVEVTITGPGNLTLLPTLAENISQLQAGIIDDLRINTTRITKKIERQYSKFYGVLGEKVSAYTYETRTFSNGVYLIAGVLAVDCAPLARKPQEVLVQESITESLFWEGKALPNRQVKTYYSWDKVGAMTATTTLTYLYLNDQWTFSDSNVGQSDPIQLMTTMIAFWNELASNIKSTKRSTSRVERRPVDQWILLNGVLFEPTKFRDDQCNEISLTNTSNVLTVEVPCSKLDGLTVIWNLAREQRNLEQKNAFWVEATFTTLLDLNPHLGMDYGIQDTHGKVVSTTHRITADSATTTVVTKRLTV